MPPSTPPSRPSEPRRSPLEHVHRKWVRGKPYDYFRTRHDGREITVRLRGVIGSAEYHAHYAELLARLEKRPTPSMDGSLQALIAAYKAGPEFTALAVETRSGYARALDRLEPLGRFPARAIRRPDIIKMRNKVAARHGARSADLFISVVQRMFAVGIDLGLIDNHPALDIERIATSTSYPPWPLAARDAFEASAPPERLLTAYMICRWTTLRIGDAVRLGRQHLAGGRIRIRPQKTRASSGVDVDMAVPAPLARYVETLPRDRLVFVADDDGHTVDKRRLAKELRVWMEGLGWPGLTFHGLRHTAGDELAEAGATPHEIQAVLGHNTLAMAERYSKRARRGRMADAGLAKLERLDRERDVEGVGKRPVRVGKRDDGDGR